LNAGKGLFGMSKNLSYIVGFGFIIFELFFSNFDTLFKQFNTLMIENILMGFGEFKEGYSKLIFSIDKINKGILKTFI
jgi:hypothetical protein